MKNLYIKIYLHFNPFYALILMRIIIIFYSLFFGGEVYHCDDIPSNENATGGESSHNANNQEST